MEGKGVYVHHRRIHLRRGNGIAIAQDLVLFDGDQHHVVTAARPRPEYVVVVVYVRDVEGDVLRRLIFHSIMQLRLAPRIDRNLFHDDGVARD